MYIELMKVITPCMVEQLWEHSKCWGLDSIVGASFMTDPKSTLAAYAADIHRLFPGQTIQKICLVGLRPSQQIVKHRDPPIDPASRYHLPLKSNDGCWVFHGGVWQQLLVGRIYQMDPTEWHGAVNWGDSLRVHLMFDLFDAHPRAS